MARKLSTLASLSDSWPGRASALLMSLVSTSAPMTAFVSLIQEVTVNSAPTIESWAGLAVSTRLVTVASAMSCVVWVGAVSVTTSAADCTTGRVAVLGTRPPLTPAAASG